MAEHQGSNLSASNSGSQKDASTASYDNLAIEEGDKVLYANISSSKNTSAEKSTNSKPLIIFLVLTLFVVLAVAITVIALYATGNLPLSSSDDLIFEDTFDTFRFDWWQHEITAGGGGNWEFEYYTNNRSNSYVRDNILYIKPTLTLDKFNNDENAILHGTLDLWGHTPANLCTGNAWWGCSRTGDGNSIVNPIQSARIRTVHSFSVKYGKVEVVAKMPQGDWIWPAIWMLPKYNEYGDWPASGEIDIVETKGNVDYKSPDGVSQGVDSMGSTMHWGPCWPWNGWDKTHATKFFVDDELILKVDPGKDGFYKYGGWHESIPDVMNPWANSPNKMAPFDKEFYIVMNVAVGGTNGFFWEGNINGGYPKPWSNDSPTAAKDFWEARNLWYPTWNPEVNNGESAAMQIKSVRVWRGK
uniref:Beta-1,3-glucan-binding protein-like n=1 Tax=Saccoglossus kowalevskii TaxID=10224 RepID=A0ABM0GIG3_SACKO|nr:PREDICTED: beta-1,3-glucan-binding protein-like [Saccoglossus kowalevskii]